MTGRRTKQEGANNHNIAQVPMLFTLTGAPGKHRQQQCVTLDMQCMHACARAHAGHSVRTTDSMGFVKNAVNAALGSAARRWSGLGAE